ncbi:malonate decarboxylase acyl carrier protein [Sideroxyarcus emersonii]|uniref:Malonate decarboxylase acyl carrier protein n=1 Tax=Sideroxyarcus emersonii TaxID=2764705 RepID=A0AAN2BZT7_9PROT|nr:malonate decarboxylase acyl carrier protein [Sideroxyarcus emersonii]BCK88463.1 malonate decarboxylase acyl carrier protein [Sideroxyarcus emersonii]
MEQFSLTLPSAPLPQNIPGASICGVVSSGNLEVLVEAAPLRDACTFVVNTSAHGFRDIWEAVLKDFARRHSVGGLSLSINDAGATPAVVSLRLDQAFEACRGEPA